MDNRKLLPLACASLDLVVKLSQAAHDEAGVGSPDADTLAMWTGVHYFAYAAIGRKVVDRMHWPDGPGSLQRLGSDEASIYHSVLWGSLSKGIDAASKPESQGHIHELCSGALEALQKIRPEDLKEER